jgi:hypothetical protein
MLGFEHLGMQKIAQAMRSIGPIIAKVKLAVIVNEVSYPNGTIAQIDRDFASLTSTGGSYARQPASRRGA